MLIDVSAVPGLSYFSRPQRDFFFSLLLVKTEIIVIQMFIYRLLQEMETRLEDSSSSSSLVQIFRLLLLLTELNVSLGLMNC